VNARITVDGVSVSVSGASSDDIAGVAVRMLQRSDVELGPGSAYRVGQRKAMAASREVAFLLKIAAEEARQAGSDVGAALVVALANKRVALCAKGYADDVIDAAFARAQADWKWRELLVSHPSKNKSAPA
jgi:hypothetical protein